MMHIVYAKTSEDIVDNYLKFYKEEEKYLTNMVIVMTKM